MKTSLLSAWKQSSFLSSVVLGVLGFAISFAGSWRPSPWLDEAATAHIIGYSFADMSVLWERTDAVLAPYYTLLNAWVALAGISPMSLRLPSLLAVGAGTAAMAATGRTLGGPRAQIWFAACFALLPRVTAMGIEARPYAFSAMFMAFVLLAVVKLRVRRAVAYWVVLGLSMIGAVHAHLFAVLPLCGLLAVAFMLFPGRTRLALVLTSAVSGLACLPLVLAAAPQQGQVSWLSDSDYSIADQALVESWFTTRWNVTPVGSDVPLHYIAVTLTVLAALTVALAVLGTRRLPKARLVVAVVPPALAVSVLWGASVLDEPMLLGRYLTSSAPFIAMLLAECLMLLRPHLRRVLAAVLAVGCIFLITAQRQPYAKVPGQDYAFIASSLHDQARDGEGLLIEPGLGPVDSARNAFALYPAELGRLNDLALPHRPPLTHVFAADPPIADLSQAQLPDRVWLVTKVDQASGYAAQLRNLGFRPDSASSGPGHTVTLWTKS